MLKILETEDTNNIPITENENLKKGTLVNKLNIRNIEHDNYKITKESYDDISIYHFPGHNEYDDFTIVVAKNNKDSISKANELANNLLIKNKPVYLLGAIICNKNQDLSDFNSEIKQFSSTCHNVCILADEQRPYLLSVFFSEGAFGIHSIPSDWLNDFTYHDIFYIKVIPCRSQLDLNKNLNNLLELNPTNARKVLVGLVKEENISLNELAKYSPIIEKLYNRFPDNFSIKFGVSISHSFADLIILEQI